MKGENKGLSVLINYLISCMISNEMQPAMPFGWDLRSIVTVLGSILHPPVSSYKSKNTTKVIKINTIVNYFV